jgi:UDP-N-acetylglucosamine/UDP-N-acetylgalactosamine diphosphorylase
MEVDARRAFAPVKNAPGDARDTPESVQVQMAELFKEWLADTGARVEPGVPVEISPLFALDESDIVARQREGRLPRELHVTQPRFFC